MDGVNMLTLRMYVCVDKHFDARDSYTTELLCMCPTHQSDLEYINL